MTWVRYVTAWDHAPLSFARSLALSIYLPLSPSLSISPSLSLSIPLACALTRPGAA